MNGWLVFCVVLLSVTLVAVIIGIALYVRRINQVAREIAETLAEVRGKIVPLADDLRYVITNTDGLISGARSTVDSYAKVAESVERLVEGKTIAEAAGKVVASSRSTVGSILEGAKEAIKAFRTAKPEASDGGSDSEDNE
jgi:hypothetical protein